MLVRVTNTKKLNYAIRDHIIANITDYDGNEFSNQEEAISFLSKTFHSEYGHELKRMPKTFCIRGKFYCMTCRNYLQGLPSVCTINFSNYDIYQFLINNKLITENMVDLDDGSLMDQYWETAGYQLAKLLKLF